MTRRWPPLLLAILASIVSLPMYARSDSIRTEGGVVEGVSEGGVLAFKGIPFAAQPVGNLRWRAPVKAQPWIGVLKADHFSPICPQHGMYPDDAPAEPMSEDCLYLNIWVPATKSGAPLAVMVWIYGGGLMNGSASTPLYAGDALAQEGVIVVTANYRLGALGFLAHPDLTRESPEHVSGNYGLLDQLAALNWVHRNIAAFGGDPSRVTVFGQSSGSITISALTTSPLARGLFQRAIGESGGLFEPIELSAGYSLAGAEKSGRSFVKSAGAETLRDLRAMPASEIIKARFIPHLVIDGYVLPQSPYEAYRKGKQNDIDLLLGSNAEEGRLFMEHDITAGNLTKELSNDFSRLVVLLIGPGSVANDEDARKAFVAFEGAMRFGWDMWAWARLQCRFRRGAFLYRFSHASPYRSVDKHFGWGASHGMEMPYVFNHLDLQSLPWTLSDRMLARAMQAYWTNFAKYGDPNGPGLRNWPRFTDRDPRTLLIANNINTGPVPDKEQLERIDRLYRVSRFLHRNRIEAMAIGVGAIVAGGIAVRSTRTR